MGRSANSIGYITSTIIAGTAFTLVLTATVIVTNSLSSSGRAEAEGPVKCKKRDENGQCVYDTPKPPPGKKRKRGPQEPTPGDHYTETGYGGVCGTTTDPDTGDDYDCMAAHCELPSGENGRRQSIWSRVWTYEASGQWVHGAWQDTGESACRRIEADEITQADVIRKVKDFGLRPAEVATSPPNGRTLVNFRTVFYSPAKPYEFLLPLGPGVEIRATPAKFQWHFDDGNGKTTNTAGRPYPHMDIWHKYATVDKYSPSVDVEYRVEWRIQGATDYQSIPDLIPGQTGAGHPITVVQTQAELGDN